MAIFKAKAFARFARRAGLSDGSLIAFRSDVVAIFLFGFELRTLQLIAAQWLADPTKVDRDVAAGILVEVEYSKPDAPSV